MSNSNNNNNKNNRHQSHSTRTKNPITGNKPRVETHLRRKPAQMIIRIDQAVKDELYKTVAGQNSGYYHNKISAFVQKAISDHIKKVKTLENSTE